MVITCNHETGLITKPYCRTFSRASYLVRFEHVVEANLGFLFDNPSQLQNLVALIFLLYLVGSWMLSCLLRQLSNSIGPYNWSNTGTNPQHVREYPYALLIYRFFFPLVVLLMYPKEQRSSKVFASLCKLR